MFQIISPHDKEIKSHILANLAPLSSSWDLSILRDDNPLLSDPYDQIWKAYMSDLQQLSLYRFDTLYHSPLKKVVH